MIDVSESLSMVGYAESPTGLEETPGQTPESVITALERNGVNFIGSEKGSKTKNGKPKISMRIDIPATTPTRTITAVTSMLWEDLVNNPKKENTGDFVNRKKIQCAEKMIRGAFMELYRGLGLLKTYRFSISFPSHILWFPCKRFVFLISKHPIFGSSLNMIAFTKILKKFDKVRFVLVKIKQKCKRPRGPDVKMILLWL